MQHEDDFPTREPDTRESVLPLTIIDELVSRIHAAPTAPPTIIEIQRDRLEKERVATYGEYLAWVRAENARFA